MSETHTSVDQLIYNIDGVAGMGELPAGCARLVFCDPPYNQSVGYDTYRDRIADEAYLTWTYAYLDAAARLLVPIWERVEGTNAAKVVHGGALLCYVPDAWAAEIAVHCKYKLGLHLVNWIIHSYGFGQHQETKFSRCKTHLLYFAVDPVWRVFRNHDIKVPSDRATRYNDARAVMGGKTPGDVWWDIPRLCGTFNERAEVQELFTREVTTPGGQVVTEKIGHPAQLPMELCERIVLSMTLPGELVVDSFAGSGTMLAACKKHGRSAIGFDISPNYCMGIARRLEQQ